MALTNSYLCQFKPFIKSSVPFVLPNQLSQQPQEPVSHLCRHKWVFPTVGDGGVESRKKRSGEDLWIRVRMEDANVGQWASVSVTWPLVGGVLQPLLYLTSWEGRTHVPYFLSTTSRKSPKRSYWTRKL